MTSTISVRPSRDEDVPFIQAIYGDAVLTAAASFELDPPPVEEMARRRRAVLDGGYPYLVAELDGKVVGYAYASAYRIRPAYRFSVENSIYVAPGLKGRGIGAALLAPLIEDCAARGFRQMIAVIGDSANAASIGLHTRFGFRMIGTFEAAGYKFGRWVDSVFMQRALGDGSTTPPRER